MGTGHAYLNIITKEKSVFCVWEGCVRVQGDVHVSLCELCERVLTHACVGVGQSQKTTLGIGPRHEA